MEVYKEKDVVLHELQEWAKELKSKNQLKYDESDFFWSPLENPELDLPPKTESTKPAHGQNKDSNIEEKKTMKDNSNSLPSYSSKELAVEASQPDFVVNYLMIRW